MAFVLNDAALRRVKRNRARSANAINSNEKRLVGTQITQAGWRVMLIEKLGRSPYFPCLDACSARSTEQRSPVIFNAASNQAGNDDSRQRKRVAKQPSCRCLIRCFARLTSLLAAYASLISLRSGIVHKSLFFFSPF